MHDVVYEFACAVSMRTVAMAANVVKCIYSSVCIAGLLCNSLLQNTGNFFKTNIQTVFSTGTMWYLLIPKR